MILTLGAMVPLGGNKVSIDYEGLEAYAKSLADLCKRIIARIKERWSVIKRVALSWFETLPESSNTIVSKPYPALRFTKGKRIKRVLLINKPRRLCVRTNC